MLGCAQVHWECISGYLSAATETAACEIESSKWQNPPKPVTEALPIVCQLLGQATGKGQAFKA